MIVEASKEKKVRTLDEIGLDSRVTSQLLLRRLVRPRRTVGVASCSCCQADCKNHRHNLLFADTVLASHTREEDWISLLFATAFCPSEVIAAWERLVPKVVGCGEDSGMRLPERCESGQGTTGKTFLCSGQSKFLG
jgi:hypothetical protein